MSFLPGSRIAAMLPVLGERPPILSRQMVNTYIGTADAASYTSTAIALGDEFSDRLIIWAVGARTDTPHTVTGVTINTGSGAVPMNLVATPDCLAPAAFASLVVPAGTTATFVTTFSGVVTRMNGHPLNMSGYDDPVPRHTAQSLIDTQAVLVNPQLGVDIPAGGIALTMATKNGSSSGFLAYEGCKPMRETGSTESMRTAVCYTTMTEFVANHQIVAQTALATHLPASLFTAVWK